MEPRYEATRLIDLGCTLRAAPKLAARERWPRERLERHQREAVDALVRHAVARSPFYAERLAGLIGAAPVELAALPTLDKATLMDRFDDVVCDRRLRGDDLLAHLDGLDHDALYLGEYRAMTTSGSSGRKGLYVYDRAAWRGILGQFFRYTAMAGVRPRLPRRLRVAAIGGGVPTHMTQRVSASVAVGLHRVRPLPATMPLAELVAELNAFQPDFVHAYPSVAVLLVAEQEAGRLRIAPRGMSTGSELLTVETAERIEAVLGVRPVDLYGTTEGLWGCSCEHGHLHLFEDLTVVENVDADGRPVPDGTRGARLLVTSLFNRVQPLIRFELSDVVAFAPEPCPCGRGFRRLEVLDGRADDVLRLPGRDGRPVAVLPTQFGVVTQDRDVREFQVVQEGDGLRLRLALREGVDADAACRRLRDGVRGRLAALGVQAPRVATERVEALERAPGGKVRLVVADRARALAGGTAAV